MKTGETTTGRTIIDRRITFVSLNFLASLNFSVSLRLVWISIAVVVLVYFFGAHSALAGGPQNMFELGCDQMMRKNFRQAIGTFTEALSNTTQDPNLYFRRGQCFFCIQDPQHAIDDFNRCIDIKKDSYQVYLWRGTAYAKLENDTNAMADYERAMQLNPALIDAYKSQKPAAPNTAVTVNPKSSKLESISLGTGENALKDYAEAVRRATDSQSAYFMPGAVYGGIVVTSSTDGGAKVLYEPAKANSEIINKDGHDYLTLKNAKKDVGDRTVAIDEYPGTPMAFFERARDFQQLGERKHALQDYMQAIELNPNSVMFYLGRAYFYHQDGQTELAAADLSKAQALDFAVPRKITFDLPRKDAVSTTP